MYQGSHRGKVGRSETSYPSPCANPAEELSSSIRVGERSFLFCEEEEEAMKKHNVAKEKGVGNKRRRRKEEAKREIKCIERIFGIKKEKMFLEERIKMITIMA